MSLLRYLKPWTGGPSSSTDTMYPIPAVKMSIINSDPHRQQEKRLVFTPIPGGGTMWIHPDLLDEVSPWTTVSCKKSRGKTKQVNVIIASTIELDSDVNSLTGSEEEEEVLAASVAGPLAAATRSGQLYLRNYDDSPVQHVTTRKIRTGFFRIVTKEKEVYKTRE